MNLASADKQHLVIRVQLQDMESLECSRCEMPTDTVTLHATRAGLTRLCPACKAIADAAYNEDLGIK